MNIDNAIVDLMRADPAEFRRRLHLPDGSPWVPDQWQDDFFRACDPGWQRAIGRDVPGGFSRAWSVRPRGHSKSTDIASMATWAVFAARPGRPVRGVIAAGDEDQARFDIDAVRRFTRANEWLQDFVEVQRGRIFNPITESECNVISSDAPTSMGLLVDFVICDELPVWRSRDLWDALFSAVAKVQTCFLAALGNAGFLRTWQGQLWERLQADPAWLCHSLPGPVASWIDQAALAEQKRVLPPTGYDRLWGNRWSLGAGDALDPGDLAACVVGKGPIAWPKQHCIYVAGLDLSSTRDHSALVLLEADGTAQKIRVADCRSWAPVAGKIDLAAVRETTIDLARRFGATVHYDPSGASLLVQDAQLAGVWCEPMQFAAGNLNAMASALLQAVREHRIELYDDPRLLDDLQRLNIVERSFGYKLEAVRDEHGHADRGIALAIALPAALAALRSGPSVIDLRDMPVVDLPGGSILGSPIPPYYSASLPNPTGEPSPFNLPGFSSNLFGGSW